MCSKTKIAVPSLRTQPSAAQLHRAHCTLHERLPRRLSPILCSILANHERSPEVLVEAAGEEDCVVSFRMHFVEIFMARLDLELHGLFGLQDEVEREEVAGWRLDSTASCEAGGPEPPGGAGGQGGIPLLPTTLATSTRKTIRLNQVV